MSSYDEVRSKRRARGSFLDYTAGLGVTRQRFLLSIVAPAQERIVALVESALRQAALRFIFLLGGRGVLSAEQAYYGASSFPQAGYTIVYYWHFRS